MPLPFSLPDVDAGPEAARRRIRAEVVRWHPDKFEARYGRRFDPDDAGSIRAGVLALSQALNALAASVLRD